MRRIRELRRLLTVVTSSSTPKAPRRFRALCTHSTNAEAAKYERKSPTEHVLLRPDTYIGGVGMREAQTCWILEGKRVRRTEVTYPPGLLKIFDEILVNAADNKARDPRMNRLEVEVDSQSGRISVWNNGNGLPVQIHPSEGIYVPTLVFGNLFTSSNYDDNEIKIVGGRNGYGAKLCNIFSTEFVVETVDTRTGKKFRQRWYDNMKQCDEAEVTDLTDPSAEDYTKVEFVADLRRFHLDRLNDDVIALIRRRVAEVAATLPRGVDVVLNGQRVDIDGFEDYVRAFEDTEQEEPIEFLFLHPTQRWHVGVAKRNGDELPRVVSFVNNINTEKGGSHVDYVVEKIVAVVRRLAEERMSGAKTVKSALVRNHLSVWINCLIENPSFESQTKETLTTKTRMFGSSFDCDSEKVAEWALETGLIDDIVDEVMNAKKRKTNTKRGSTSVRDIVKLEDAAWAGVPGKAEKCTLILTEGDSAKALALAGLEVLGRETFGVFPLKGKLINVSGLDEVRAAKNEEIGSLMRILGLKFSEPRPPLETLRYGKLMILADQDEDGSHIKGLVVNFIHRFWPQLLQDSRFIQSFRTPLLKAKRKDQVKAFFTMNDYRKWADSEQNLGKWKIKYYKGLGTSTSNEAREYFSQLPLHVVNFKLANEQDDEAIRMVFDREKTEERKEWIRAARSTEADNLDTEMSYKEFVDGELMQFGTADLRRSIPSLVDGLKPSQRKILWTLLQMSDSVEMKVSQLAGAVAHSQSYHHGEESLVRTIVRMGQTFCGASNLPLLQPIGQFGTRHEGGTDAASARYIFTALAPTTRLLFPSADDDLLEKRNEEGLIVEPNFLCPIIPLILVNGTEGIGTGWSTKVINRKVTDIIDLLRWSIDDAPNRHDAPPLLPYFEDFHGKIEADTKSTRFFSSGRIRLSKPERRNSATITVEILELPVGMWTSKYKERLHRIIESLPVLEFSEHHTEKQVHFRIVLDRKRAAGVLQKSNAELLSLFKLRTPVTENLVLFDGSGQLREFQNVHEIAREFFTVRKDLYERRLEVQKEEAKAKLEYVQNQIKFIDSVTNGTIELRAMGRSELERKMGEMGFAGNPTAFGGRKDYGYLLEMPLSRLTAEEVHRLAERKARRTEELARAEAADWKSTWHSELDRLAQGVTRNL
ncbi:unnamed protein product [Caenorhabditis sp. 36 PRJEB53466]|nr:unnamed protein product [Caenorhabditis sp. 36 PRJEB53466]